MELLKKKLRKPAVEPLGKRRGWPGGKVSSPTMGFLRFTSLVQDLDVKGFVLGLGAH